MRDHFDICVLFVCTEAYYAAVPTCRVFTILVLTIEN